MENPRKIFHLLKNIESSTASIDDRLDSTLKNIEDYIKAVSFLNNLVVTDFKSKKKVMFLRYFEIEIEVQSKLKTYEYGSSPSYCDEVTFSVTRVAPKENELIFKFYITDDGYIVDDPTKQGSIGEVSNQYTGRTIVELLFSALDDKKIISI